MKTIIGNNNFALVNDTEFELDSQTSIITNAEVAESFGTKEELNTFVASKDVTKFPPLPDVGEWCEKGIVYAYGANKAKCLQSHTRTSFPPEQTPALFTVITTVVGYPVWKQPQNISEAYIKSALVYFPTINDFVYKSLINGNMLSPAESPGDWKKV
jgi:hypothetical protein